MIDASDLHHMVHMIDNIGYSCQSGLHRGKILSKFLIGVIVENFPCHIRWSALIRADGRLQRSDILLAEESLTEIDSDPPSVFSERPQHIVGHITRDIRDRPRRGVRND